MVAHGVNPSTKEMAEVKKTVKKNNPSDSNQLIRYKESKLKLHLKDHDEGSSKALLKVIQ